MKKLLLGLLSIIFIWISAFTLVSCSSGTEGLRYELSDDGKSYEVMGIGTATDTDIIIPSTYNELPVTSIGAFAFSGCSSLTSIKIFKNVISIGRYAFKGCSSLKNITIPDSVTSIGDGVLWGCSSLESITIPDSITYLGHSTFYDCSSLETITIPDSVKWIGNFAFLNCCDLTSITIPDSVAWIGQEAFCRCDSLTDVYYIGTEEQWSAIYIDKGNSDLTYAAITYNYVPIK